MVRTSHGMYFHVSVPAHRHPPDHPRCGAMLIRFRPGSGGGASHAGKRKGTPPAREGRPKLPLLRRRPRRYPGTGNMPGTSLHASPGHAWPEQRAGVKDQVGRNVPAESQVTKPYQRTGVTRRVLGDGSPDRCQSGGIISIASFLSSFRPE
jgi:hypothetical protein